MSGDGEDFVASLDIGTTTIRCLIVDRQGTTRGYYTDNIVLEHPQPGRVEINPTKLYNQVVAVITGAVKNSGVPVNRIKCMGITSQRCSFVLWDVNNNEPIHNIITWQDTRASSLVRSWNKSAYVRLLRFGSKLLYGITRNPRYLSGSVLRLMNEQVVIRLQWMLNNVEGLKKKIADNQIKFGTIDTYIIYKLTDGVKHVTDFSCAAPTGFFDPYLLEWAGWAMNLFSIPKNILPEVVPTCGNHFGYCKIFPGVDIPILCSIADQSSSVFGSGLFSPGDVKVTLGTGSFLDVNTGDSPHASVAGIYPLVGWKYGSELVYLAEGQSKDTGIVIDWGKAIGLYDSVDECSALAKSVCHSNGVYFIPAFHGLQAPYNDHTACGGFIGISATTKKAHMVRALLESIAFRVHQLLNVLQSETVFEFDHIRADGGVAKNDFILQTLSTLTGKRVERSTNTEATALGCAFMAGMYAGIWKTRDELKNLYKVERSFLPKVEHEELIHTSFVEWERAVERCLSWQKE